ncbi:hypothetical protein ABPG77_007331 [Micractinium sp. CCAP 211/92]
MLWGHVRAALLHRGTQPAVLSPPETLSAAQLLQIVEVVAILIQGASHQLDQAFQGHDPAICAIFLTNSAAYVAAALAALRLGLAFMPLDPGWPPCRLQAVCAEARTALIIWAEESAAGGHGQPAVAGVPLLRLPDVTHLAQQAAALQQQTRQAAGVAPALPSELSPLGVPHSSCSSGSGGSGGSDDGGPAAGPPECCYVLYTSGSTGRPLGVRGTEAGVLNRCRWLEGALPFQPDDRVAFKTAPCFVDSIWEVFGPLLAGVPLLVVPQATSRRPAELLRLLASQRATHLAAVPTLWRALAGAMQGQPNIAAQLRLRLAVSSGEPLAPGLLGQLQRQLPGSCTIWNLYGSSEVAADCTAFDCTSWQPARPAGGQGRDKQQQQQQQQQHAAGSVQHNGQRQDQQGQQQPGHSNWVPVGCPIGGASVAVLGPEPEGGLEPAAGAPGPAAEEEPVSRRQGLPAGKLGEVAVGGTVVAAGYLGADPATLAAQRARFVLLPASQLVQAARPEAAGPGSPAVAERALPQHERREQAGDGQLARVFITGDLGWLDSSGCLHLVGRRDLQAKISGARVDLSEVASALDEHAAVAAAAAKIWHLPAGPVLEAYVELAAGQSAGSGELRDWCKRRLPPAAVPQYVHVLAGLPRSAGGKVQRSELQPSVEVAAVLVAEAPAASTEAQAAAQGGSPLSEPNHPAKRPRPASAPPAAEAERPAAAALPAPAPPLQRRSVSEVEVSAAFALALGHSDFEATTNLFSIGGTSLTAAEIAGLVASGRIESVLQHPTVRSLAAHLSELAARQASEGRLAAAAGDAPGGEAQRSKPAHLEQEESKQPAAAEAAAAVARARLLDVITSARAEPAEQLELVRSSLHLAWRAKLLQCVDAAPLMVAEEQLARPSQPAHAGAGCIFACSHGGDVCCFDIASGQRRWQTILPDRTDAGLALCHGPSPSVGGSMQATQQGMRQSVTQQQSRERSEDRQQSGSTRQAYLAAATNGDELFFLDAAGGAVAGSMSLGAGICAPPVCDPWAGLVWQPTHGRQLLVVAAPGREVDRLPLPAAVSAAVSFSAARRMAFVCCLDGSLLAIQAKEHQNLQKQHAQQEEQRAQQEAAAGQLSVAWQWRAMAPLFTPALVAGSSVLAAAVDGSIAALSCHNGSPQWCASVPGPVFAPPLLLASPPAAVHSGVVLVGTQGGQLVALEGLTGRQLAVAHVGDRVTGLQLLPQTPSMGAEQGGAGPSAAGERHNQRQLVVATLACGVVVLMNAGALLEGSASSTGESPNGSAGNSNTGSEGHGEWLVDSVRLPGDVFAVPAAFPVISGGVSIALGCRDDHLYCLAVHG